MRTTRLKAITTCNALTMLERGADGKPYDLTCETYILMFVMLRSLKETLEPWQKARETRMRLAAGEEGTRQGPMGLEIVNAAKMQKFVDEEQTLLEQPIRFKFPKKKLDLNLTVNKIPARVLLDMEGVWQAPETAKIEFDDDDDDEDVSTLRAAE